MPLTEIEIRILQELVTQEAPMGARRLRDCVSADLQGISESTLNRILTGLDERGFTCSTPSGQGRAITDMGSRIFNQEIRNRELRASVDQLKLRSLVDLEHLLIARIAVEAEVVRAVTNSANSLSLPLVEEAHFAYIDVIDDDIARRVIAADFHKELVDICPNPMLRAAGQILFSSKFSLLEQALDVLRKEREHISNTRHEHGCILRAIHQGEADKASRLMTEHLQGLLQDIRGPIRPETRRAIEELLQETAKTGQY